MTQSSVDFVQNNNNNSNKQMKQEPCQTNLGTMGQEKIAEHQQQQQKQMMRTNCDILLNNFQIKKKNYRVLLNGDHIVWEQMHMKPTKDEEIIKNQHQTQEQQQHHHHQQLKVKECEHNEHEQLSSSSSTSQQNGNLAFVSGTNGQQHMHTMSTPIYYGSKSHLMHIDEIISVQKGESKHAAQCTPPTPVSINMGVNISTTSEVASPTTTAATATTATIAAGATTGKPTAQYLCIHYAERILKSATDCNRWQIRRLTLYNADPYIVRQWHETLNELLAMHPTRLHVRRLLVFINPYGGRKQGLTMYERHCKPIFQLAGIDASCIISQRANQIRDILMSHDLSVFDAVCCVGGDGTVAEVINGLLYRTMRELGLDEQRPAYIPKPMLPVGVIPAGSTDTIAYSMHGTSDVRTAAIHLILGQRRGLDVCSVRNSTSLLRFCASVLSYGYLGDVAAKSEQYRWMGTKRYEYTGVKAFINNRGYDAELRIMIDECEDQQTHSLPHSVQATSTSNNSSLGAGGDADGDVSSVCYANCKRCSIAASVQESLAPEKTQVLYGADTDVDDDEDALGEIYDTDKLTTSVTPVDEIDRLVLRCPTGADDIAEHMMETLPSEEISSSIKPKLSVTEVSLLRSEPSTEEHLKQAATLSFTSSSISSQTTPTTASAARTRWLTIKGKFFMICGANMTCACSRSPNGLSKFSHLGDGYLDLILVRKTSLLNNVRFLLNTAGRDGDIRNLPFVEVYRTRKFNFRTLQHSIADEAYSITGSCQPIAEAFPGSDNYVSSWNCDGEVVTDLDVTMSSHCQLVDVFMRGPYSYTKPSKDLRTETPTPNSVFCCCRD